LNVHDKARHFNEQYNKTLDDRIDLAAYNSGSTTNALPSGAKKRKTSDNQESPRKAPRKPSTRSKHGNSETFNIKQEPVIDLTGDDDIPTIKPTKSPKKSGKATKSSPKKGEEKRLKRYVASLQTTGHC